MANSGSELKIGEAGLALIREFEDFSSHLYDTDGGGHCTVGWGHLVHKGKCDGRENEGAFKQGITNESATNLLKKDIATAERTVKRKCAGLTLTLNQNQFDALVVFTYNTGSGSLSRMLHGAINKKGGKLDMEKIPARMRLYDKSDGKALAGLTRRRKREADLFETKEVKKTEAR